MPIDKLKNIIRDPETDSSETSEAINSFDHFEIARLFHQFSQDEKVFLFQHLKDDKKRQELLYETDIDSRQEVINSLSHDYMAAFLEKMPEDEATDILKELDDEIQETILAKMVPREARAIKELIRFEEETAGGMMNPHFNKVTENQTSSEILLRLKRERNDYGQDYFVVGPRKELVGYFNLKDLLNAPPNAKVSQFTREKTQKVGLEDKCEKIANLMDHEHLTTVPVVDENNIIQGVVTFDDVLRIIQDTASEDIFTMVGTAKVDPFAKRTLGKIAARVPWLLTTFVGGLVSAIILQSYEIEITKVAMILFFIPFVLGLAGNVGIQGATVIVRGLATGDIQADNIKSVMISELSVGILNGLIFGILCGGLITILAFSWGQVPPLLGLGVGLGIFLAVGMAAIIGSMIPLFFLNMNIDPAISTGPVVTVINDIMGLLIYLFTTTTFLSSV